MQMRMEQRIPNPGDTCSSASLVSYLRALLVILALGLAANGAAADDVVVEERDVSGFSGIVLSGSGDLHITQGDSESLRITAEPKVLAVLTSEVRGDVLHLSRKRGSNVRSRHSVRYDITLRELGRLGMSGSGDAFMPRLEVMISPSIYPDLLILSWAKSCWIHSGSPFPVPAMLRLSNSTPAASIPASVDRVRSSLPGRPMFRIFLSVAAATIRRRNLSAGRLPQLSSVPVRLKFTPAKTWMSQLLALVT